MRPPDPGTTMATPTTRRHVVKTGATLAYAAPLVAATLGLTALDARAACACPPRTKAGSYFAVTRGPNAGQCTVCSATALGYDAVANRCLLAGPKAVSPSGYVAKICDAISPPASSGR